MNQEIKQKFAQALRSDSFKQVKDSLYNGYGYCCLGVLTHLYLEEICDISKLSKEEYMERILSISSAEMPGEEVKQWSGLCYEDCVHLAQLNDQEGLVFPSIADYVENNY